MGVNSTRPSRTKMVQGNVQHGDKTARGSVRHGKKLQEGILGMRGKLHNGTFIMRGNSTANKWRKGTLSKEVNCIT